MALHRKRELSPIQATRQSWGALSLAVVFLSLAVAGCPTGVSVNAPGSEPLDTLRESGQAVARLYATRIPFLPADHTWFVVKRADAGEFQRWEMFTYNGGIYGYIFSDLFAPEADLGAGGTRILAEVVGPDAEPLIDCIETASATYPCRDYYVFFPGPNSNGFTQWLLNECGWDVSLPADVVGKDVACHLAR